MLCKSSSTFHHIILGNKFIFYFSIEIEIVLSISGHVVTFVPRCVDAETVKVKLDHFLGAFLHSHDLHKDGFSI